MAYHIYKLLPSILRLVMALLDETFLKKPHLTQEFHHAFFNFNARVTIYPHFQQM